jgi:hypothetical protein
VILGACAAAAVVAGTGAGITVAFSRHTDPPKPAVHHAQALTATQGATICNSLNGWISTAVNQDQPRLSFAEIVPAGADLQGTQLGSDIATEITDLQEDNSLALETGTFANSSGVANTTALSSDCATYGVTLNWQPGGP